MPPPIPSSNSPLERNAGAGKVLFLDTASGIAGDMTVAALLDLGVPFTAIAGEVKKLPLTGYELELEAARSGAIGGSRFHVRLSAPQPERRYAAIDALLGDAPLDPAVSALARRIFALLAAAESEVHRVPLADVAFHEVGAVDSIVDVVAAAAGFVYLGARVIGSPLPLGRGTVQSQHGLLPLPAPATLLCLRGVPTYPLELGVELVTPTGAAIYATVVESFASWPALSPERVGWGCGTRVLASRPNAVRAVLGSAPSTSERRDTSAAAAPDAFDAAATHVVIDANIDDMSGELAAHAIDALLAAGALDAWAAPITMKKGRPALIVSALAPRELANAIAAVLLTETSTIGVRQTLATRVERPRRVLEVTTPFGPIPLKISEGPYGPPQIKPEFEACARAARAAGVPVRAVIAAALAAYSAR